MLPGFMKHDISRKLYIIKETYIVFFVMFKEYILGFMGNSEAQRFIALYWYEQKLYYYYYKWIDASCNQGNLKAMAHWGGTLFDGKQYDVAYYWLRKCVIKAEGYTLSKAAYYLAQMYRYGLSIEKDYQEAIKWYTLSDFHYGCPLSCNELGLMYYNGVGVEQNYKKALMLFRKSGFHGYAPSVLSLGVMYYYGQGVEQNIEKGEKLIRLSVKLDKNKEEVMGNLYAILK